MKPFFCSCKPTYQRLLILSSVGSLLKIEVMRTTFECILSFVLFGNCHNNAYISSSRLLVLYFVFTAVGIGTPSLLYGAAF